MDDLTPDLSGEGPVIEIIRKNALATVWAYIRVSSKKQEDDGYGLDMQRDAVLAHCKAQGLGTPVIIEEVASAAKPVLSVSYPGAPADQTIAPRPRLLLLLGQLSDRPKVEKHLVLFKLDRLSRVAYEQEMLLEVLNRANCKTHSTQTSEQAVLDGGDARDPGRVLFRQMMGAFAQYERSIIQIRMQAGLRAKAALGEWVGGGIPFGYRVKDTDLVVDPADSVVVQRIFYLRQQQGLSLSKVAGALQNRWGVTGWKKMRVKRVIDNESLYRGIYIDPFDVRHNRPDLRILPEDWHEWLEQTDPGIPTFGDAHGE